MYTQFIRVISDSAFANSLASQHVSGRILVPWLLLGLLLGSGFNASAQAGELHPGQNFSEWDQIPMATGSSTGSSVSTSGQRSAVSSSDAKHPRLSQNRIAWSMQEGPGSWIGADESDLWHAFFCLLFAHIP